VGTPSFQTRLHLIWPVQLHDGERNCTTAVAVHLSQHSNGGSEQPYNVSATSMTCQEPVQGVGRMPFRQGTFSCTSTCVLLCVIAVALIPIAGRMNAESCYLQLLKCLLRITCFDPFRCSTSHLGGVHQPVGVRHGILRGSGCSRSACSFAAILPQHRGVLLDYTGCQPCRAPAVQSAHTRAGGDRLWLGRSGAQCQHAVNRPCQ